MIDKCYIIPVQKACNADCRFCISKSRDYKKDVEFLDVNSDFIKTLEIFKEKGIRKFEITGGGEPLFHPNIELIVNLIKTIIPNSFVKLYTNGTIFKEIEDLDEVNISVVHYDCRTNDKFMGFKDSISLAEKLSHFYSNYFGCKLRLSIPLIKGAIDKPSELEEMINHTEYFDISEYVVRTLYPSCPSYKELYVDFDYKRDNVIFERDNDVRDFSSIILWSDGKLYTNWELNQQRYLYSYLLFKPDARTYINEIDGLIHSKNFNVVKRLLVSDFITNAINLYQDKSKEYLELVKRHLVNSARLFGNTGLVYVLDKNVTLDELVKKTYDLKVDIRNKFGFTQNYGGYVNFEGENYHLNLVHAPDAQIDFYNRDLNLIEKFTNIREISESEFSLVKKYRSFNL